MRGLKSISEISKVLIGRGRRRQSREAQFTKFSTHPLAWFEKHSTFKSYDILAVDGINRGYSRKSDRQEPSWRVLNQTVAVQAATRWEGT